MAHVQELLAGRYELLDVLGRGGMGVVYRARDSVLRRIVAVKVLRVDEVEDPTFVARFEREARAAASLSHPNVIAVYDSGHDGGRHFIVMEYVAGKNLAELLAERGPLPPAEVVAIGSQIAAALAVAHDAGIVHRDVKPANAMVDDAGHVKVLDFGIARALADTRLTRTANVIGSAPYLAPEITRGELADTRSDIYSLGCVLYELLSGAPPFTGEQPAAVLYQHNTAAPRPLSKADRRIPAALDALVLQMLAKDPAERPQRAADVARALAQTLQGNASATAPTRRLAAVAAPRRLGRRERLLLAAAAALLALGIALALVLPSSSHRSPPRRKTAPARAVTTTTTATRTTTASHTTPSTTASSTSSPTTVVGAAGALTTLVTHDLQSGLIDQQAANPITAAVQGALNGYDSGNVNAALGPLQNLNQQMAQMASHGDIKPAALGPLQASVDNLQAAIEHSTPPAQTQPAPPGQAKGKQPKPPKRPHH